MQAVEVSWGWKVEEGAVLMWCGELLSETGQAWQLRGAPVEREALLLDPARFPPQSP